MIFVCVGTQLPFDRLVRAMDGWCAQNELKAFAQVADVRPDGYLPKNMAWERFLSPDDWDERFATADLVVAHAGMGTIISALMAGKPIVIMPRKAARQEHRNDHQIATAQRFNDRPGIYVAMDEFELPKALEFAIRQPANDVERLGRYADPSLIETIRGFVLSSK